MIRTVLFSAGCMLAISPAVLGQESSPPLVSASHAESVGAAGPQRIAVLALQAAQLSPGQLQQLRSGIAEVLARDAAWSSVPAAEVDAALASAGDPAMTSCREPACLARIARITRAPRILHGRVEPIGEGHLLTLLLCDAEGGLLQTETAFWNGPTERLGELAGPYADRLLAGSRRGELRGQLVLSAPDGAVVKLDGRSVGTTPLAAAQLSVATGVHTIDLQPGSGAPMRREVVVQRDQRLEVNFSVSDPVEPGLPAAEPLAVAVAPTPVPEPEPAAAATPDAPVVAAPAVSVQPSALPETAVASLTTVAAPAAPSDRPTLALLDLRSQQKPTDSLASALTVVVAAEIGATGKYQVISRNDMKSMLTHQTDQQLLGCAEVQCMADLAKALAADFLVAGSVEQIESAHVLSLELIDPVRAKVVERQTATWRGDPERMVELARPYVDRLLAGSRAQSFTGALEVFAPEGATVVIDNTEAGVAPLSEAVGKLSTGVHTIKVSKPGFISHQADEIVVRGETTLVRVELIDEDAAKPWYARWWVWGSVGGGLALVGGTAAAIAVVAVLTNTPTTVGVTAQ